MIKTLKDEETLRVNQELNYSLEDIIEIYTNAESNKIYEIAQNLKPWRKGPFKIGDIFIDSEWKSYIKYNILKEHFDLKDKIVGDIGCNNGYYMFRMLKDCPKELIGFDPSTLFKAQFEFINSFIKAPIKYELLGVESLENYGKKFDTLFCLGVLYHRSDPIGTLKSLANSLLNGGELFLDTFIISGDSEMVLSPKRYSKIKNVYFIPTINALKNWLDRAYFDDIKVIGVYPTTLNEQRKTDWILSESLDDFLDCSDSSKTVEGYEAPTRVYIKARRK